MKSVRALVMRIAGLFGLRRAEREFDQELQSLIEMHVDALRAQGYSPEEADRRARAAVGSPVALREAHRDSRIFPRLESIVQDVRYAVRGFRRQPGFAFVCIVTLALGIGANTAIFSLVNGVLLQPLSFADPDRIYAAGELIFDGNGRGGFNPIVSPAHVTAWAAECPSLEQVALMRGGRVQVATGGEPASVTGMRASYNLFTLFGVAPIRGRAFLPEEGTAGHEHVAILSEGFWRARFNADPAILHQSIAIDGEPYQVIGVAPASFHPPYLAGQERTFDIYRPLVVPAEELARLMGNYNYVGMVRLRRGITADQALAEINVVQARFPKVAMTGVQLKAALTPAHEMVTGQARAGLWMLAAAVAAVLLIVCVNLANLFLSRMASRGRESAIRTALGASRARQFAQVMIESLMLSVTGGALGWLLAGWTLQIVIGTSTFEVPRLGEVRLDATVLAFTGALTVIAGLVFGALPAWRMTRQDPQEALRAGSHTVTEPRSGLRLRQILIGFEVGMSAALLIVAALLIASLTRLLHVDKGFDGDRVLAVDLELRNRAYRDDATRDQFFDRLVARTSAIGGVEAAGFITALPILGNSWQDPIYLEGASREEKYPVNNRYASPGYFPALRIAIRQGRAFADADRGRHVAVLSTKAAQLLWPGDPNPIGRLFMGEDDKLKTLVGIVDDVRTRLGDDPPAMAYYPYWQRVPDGMTLVVRTTGDPKAVAGGVRDALRAEDAEMPIAALRTIDDIVNNDVAPRRFQMTLMLVFAASALLVAALGIYGVVSYSVARRQNELGIRMALGAGRTRVLSLVVRQGMAPVVIGLGGGIAAALVFSRAIRGLLFEIQPTDPPTIAGVAVLLIAVGAIACLIPARRATSTDAILALRLN